MIKKILHVSLLTFAALGQPGIVVASTGSKTLNPASEPSMLIDLTLAAVAIIMIIILARYIMKRGVSEKVALQFGTKRFKKRTILILSVFVILVVVMGILSVGFIKNKITKGDQIALEQTAESTKQKIDFWVQKRDSDVKEFLSSKLFQDYINTPKTARDTSNVPAATGFNFCLVDKDLNIKRPNSNVSMTIANVGEECQKKMSMIFSGQEIYMNDLEDTIKKCFQSEEQEKGVLYKGIPIYVEDEIENVIICEIFSSSEISELLRFSRVGESGESYLINDEGLMLTKSRFENDLAELNYYAVDPNDGNLKIEIKNPGANIFEENEITRSGNEEFTLMADELIKKKSGSNVSGYLDYRGVPVHGAWIWLEEYNLGLATEIDRAESLDVFYFIRYSAFTVLFIVILIIVASILFSISLGEKANEVLIKAKDDLEHLVLERTSELHVQTSALQAAANAIFITDLDGKIIWTNKATSVLTGFDEGELLGENPRIFKSGQHSQSFYKDLWDTINRGEVWTGELINQRKNKEIYTEEMTIAPVKNKSGEVTNFVAVKQDISERKKAEKEIINEQKRFAQLLDSTPDAMVIINEEGEIVVVNSQLLKLFGYERKELIGSKVEILMPQSLKSTHITHRKGFFGNPKSRNMGSRTDLFAKRKDDELFPVEISLNPINTDDGTLVAAAIRDITERKELQNRIKDSEQRLQFAIEGSNDGLWDWNVKTGEVFLSSRFESMIGYEPGTLTRNYDALKDIVHPDDLALMLEKMTEHYEGKTDQYELEYRVKNGDGNYSWILSKGKMVEFDENKQPIRFVGIHSDITQRKQLEAEILKSEQQLQAALEGSSDGVFDINFSTGEMYVSPLFEAMLGYQEKELLNKCNSQLLFDLVHEKDYNKLEEALGLHLGGETENFSCEYRMKMKSGTYKWIAARAKVVGQMESGEPQVRLVGTHTDIQRRKELEIALERANERMSGELNIAKDIQMSMLPLTFPAFPKRKDIDVYANLIPAREVGGDFYDFHFLDDNHLCFAVGDVSGKGVPAALMMAVCKTLLKSKAGSDRSTASIMTQVNNEMAQENSNYMFVTVFLGILNTNTGELTYTNAGHNPTFIRRADGSIEHLRELHGPVVAAMEGLPYKESKAQLDPNDFVFAYTDGIPEAHNSKDELYGNERLDNFMIDNNFNSAQTVVEDIIVSVREFENGAEKFDDLTALCVEFHGTEEGLLKREIFEIKNELKNVPFINEKFEEFGLKNSMPMANIMKINIVLDEIIANVVNYAYKDENEHSIFVEFKISGEKLIIVIEDDGTPFSPFTQNPPDTALSVEEREVGGLGIHLVKSLMDDCLYTRLAEKNVVTLTMYNISEVKK